MAKNLYQSAFKASSSAGRYKASMYDVSSKNIAKEFEDAKLQYEQNIFNQNIGAIADTLSLASTVAGRYEDLSGDISLLEKKYGEMERPKGIFGKMMQSTKIGLGLGDYKFGDEIISARNIAERGSEVKYKSMLDEAMSNISPLTNVELSKNLPKNNTNVDIEGDVDEGDTSFDVFEDIPEFDFDSNKIDFNKPYTMSLIK